MKDVLPLTIQGESVFHPLSFIPYEKNIPPLMSMFVPVM